MAEAFARVGDIDLCYETYGSDSDPAILLVMGLGTQMIHWDDAFCGMLVDRGHFVIRFDNRDTGRSTVLKGGHAPTPGELVRRDGRRASYTLDDMAGDAFGLLDHLGIDAAHVVGASMGGMIAQTMAILRPQRVLSLTSIMSTTGNQKVGRPALRLYPMFLRRPPRDRDAYPAHAARLMKQIGSPGHPQDPDRIRGLAHRSFDRGIHPSGTGRQLLAIFASGDRTAKLREVEVPTLVIHGANDRLVHVSGGKATAKAIPGAELLIVPGMGHDLPPGVWPTIADAIAGHAARHPAQPKKTSAVS
jgi:pimeloyl-ACP methyl ester carboxylesterase